MCSHSGIGESCVPKVHHTVEIGASADSRKDFNEALRILKDENQRLKAELYARKRNADVGSAPAEQIARGASILSLVHHWFSVGNLYRDEFLRSQMDVDGFVSLHVLSTFPSLVRLGVTPRELALLLTSSPVVQLNATRDACRSTAVSSAVHCIPTTIRLIGQDAQSWLGCLQHVRRMRSLYRSTSNHPVNEFARLFLIRKHEGYPHHARARRRDHRIDAITASMLGASVCSLRSSRAMTSTVSLAEYPDVVNRVSHALQSSSPCGRMVHGGDVESHASTSGPTRSASARTHALRSRTGLPFSQCSATHAHPLSSTYASRCTPSIESSPHAGLLTWIYAPGGVKKRVSHPRARAANASPRR